MIPMLQSLFAHQAWADALLLSAIRTNEALRENIELKKILHHTLIVQTFFLSLLEGRTPDMQAFSREPGAFDELLAAFRASHESQNAYVGSIQDSDLKKQVEMPRMPGTFRDAGDVMMQVVMHSQGHRAQVAKLFHTLGGKAPTTDYILWVKDRPKPNYGD